MATVKQTPSKTLTLLVGLKVRAIAALREAWYTEPSVILTGSVSAIVALAAAFGVVISPSVAELVAGVVVPLLIGAALRTQARPVNAAKALALAQIGSRRRVVGVYLFRRTALVARKRDERLQAAALDEGGSAWPPTDEPDRQTLYERFHGLVTPTSKLEIRKATHSERGRWVVLVAGS